MDWSLCWILDCFHVFLVYYNYNLFIISLNISPPLSSYHSKDSFFKSFIRKHESCCCFFFFFFFFSCLKNPKNVLYEYWHLDYKSLNLALSLVVKLGLSLKPMRLVSTCNLSPMMAACVTLKCMILDFLTLTYKIKHQTVRHLGCKKLPKNNTNFVCHTCFVFYCKNWCFWLFFAWS